MHPNKARLSILIADDDSADRKFLREALAQFGPTHKLEFVGDGEELLRRLQEPGPMPGLILLDLNMPKVDGREALRQIKNDVRLKHIPVVALTTSRDDEDVIQSYDLGVNSYISKPFAHDNLVAVMSGMLHYWFEVVKLPDDGIIQRAIETDQRS